MLGGAVWKLASAGMGRELRPKYVTLETTAGTLPHGQKKDPRFTCTCQTRISSEYVALLPPQPLLPEGLPGVTHCAMLPQPPRPSLLISPGEIFVPIRDPRPGFTFHRCFQH